MPVRIRAGPRGRPPAAARPLRRRISLWPATRSLSGSLSDTAGLGGSPVGARKSGHGIGGTAYVKIKAYDGSRNRLVAAAMRYRTCASSSTSKSARMTILAFGLQLCQRLAQLERRVLLLRRVQQMSLRAPVHSLDVERHAAVILGGAVKRAAL
eukprot:scaffold1574_cov373-Prasinococcus_capsulatus_cf.AAC.7